MSRNLFYLNLIESARKNPEQVALEELVSGKKYTYGELLTLVDRGIAILDSRRFQQTVVILASMDIDTVITYYAVVCSGRTAAMIDDDTESSHKAILKNEFPHLCLSPIDLMGECLSGDWNDEVTRVVPDAAEIESVLFTSGSTGKPKIFGIPGSRGIPTPLPMAAGEEYVILNVRRPSSTPFRLNLQRALLNNGRFLTVDISSISPSELDRLLSGRSVVESTVTPTMVRKVFPLVHGAWLKTFQRLHINGERVHCDDLAIVFEKMPQVVARLNYGLTEYGTISQCLIRAEDLSQLNDPISTGSPIVDVEIRHQESQDVEPQGEIGRIFVRGITGAVGKLSDVGQFEFENFDSKEWYETGDLGFLTEDGELVVLGRTQETVKIRGSRISVLEVEEIIRDTGMASDVLVSAFKDQRGNAALGALIVAPHGAEFSLAELRRRVVERFSLVMCPTKCIVVDEIPVLTTGKVDRVSAALLLSEEKVSSVAEQLDMTQLAVRQIILSALSGQALGVDEDIFQAGVDSLASLEILEKLSDAFGLILDIRVLLENPTIASLATALQNYVQPRSRVTWLSPPNELVDETIYWILPGANPYMGQKLAASIGNANHRAVLSLGCMEDDVVLPNADSMISYLVDAIVEDSPRDKHAFVAGFSSAGMFANEVVHRLYTQFGIRTGLILIDPLDPEVLTPPAEYRGVIDPVHVMLGREGRLAKLDPVRTDHALLGVQLLALSRLKLQQVLMPTLLVARSPSSQQKSLWSQHAQSQFVSIDIPHLDFVRRPEHCAPLISEFVTKALKDFD